MNNKLNITNTLQTFLTKWLDFKGRTNQLEHWIATITYITIFSAFYFLLREVISDKAISFLSLLGAIGSKSSDTAFTKMFSAFQDSEFTIYSLLVYLTVTPVLLAILVIAITSSLCRRLRDIGFATGAITILVGLLHVFLILSVPYLSLIYAIVIGLVLPLLASDSVLTNNNDGFSKFLFRQNPQAAAYYAQFGNQQFAYMPNQNQQQTTNYTNQGQVFNTQQQNIVPNQQPTQQEPQQQVMPNQTNTPTSGENTQINPFGDKVFKK